MPTRRRTLQGVLAAAAVSAALPVHAVAQQESRGAPDAYAITNARIVPVAGPTLARGTVLVRGGVIAAVGATVAVPGDARVIDGTGLTVYPGLLDAYGSLGMPGGQTPPAGGRGGGGAATIAALQGGPSAGGAGAPNSLHPPGLQPELAAADLLRPDADAFAAAQAAGITAALTAPTSGIFIGRSALIDLADDRPQALLVKSPVAMHVGFTPLRSGGYPNSLLGVFSALRQTLLDARRYGELKAAYARSPRGMRRPEHDESLEALQPVLAREMPVVMLAGTQREIERALDLAREFDLRPVIAGGAEAYKVADRLKAENVPVLLSLDFPRRAAPSPDADPEPLRVLRERAQAPRTAAALARAGVRFAFASGGLQSWPDFLTNARSSVENGLAAEQALRAMTIQPAEILGVADRLGTIEVGKIANLTITRGDLFDRTGRVTQLFVDGRPVAVRAPAATAGAPAGASGAWTLTVMLDGEKTATVMLRQEGDRLRGTLQGALGSAEIQDGSIGGDGAFRFNASVTLAGGTEEAAFAGTIQGGVIRGTVNVVGQPAGVFAGTRAGVPGEGGATPRAGGRRPPR